MPSYVYRCASCQEPPINITKPMSMASQPEPCPTCRDPMERIYEPVASRVQGGTPVHHDRAWLRGPGGQGNSIRR